MIVVGVQAVMAQYGMRVWHNGKYELYFINNVDSVQFVSFVTDLYLSQEELALNVGETKKLTATIYPLDADEKGVTWESSNNGIATVDQTGKVKAVAAGTCIITCSAADGSGVKAECQVTVIKPSSSTDGLVAYYPFNGNANDESGNGNDGTPMESVTLATGVNGDANGAYQFGGFDNPGHIHIPNSESLQFTDGATFSAYVKPTSWAGMDGWGHITESNGTQCILAKDHDWPGVAFTLHGSDEGIGFGAGGHRDPWADLSSDDLIKENYLNKWTHVAYIYGEGYARLYVDGQLLDERESTPDFSIMNSLDLYIGKFSDYWYPFCGMIDEVRIYNRALTSEEISVLAQYAETGGNAASDMWYLVARDSQGTETEFQMGSVGSLVAIDDALDFSIFDTSGNVLKEEVHKVTFRSGTAAAAVKPMTPMDNTIGQEVAHQTALSQTAQGTSSFVVADKNGNSLLVQSLIFQRDASGKKFSWSSQGSAGGYQSSFDISNLQFIARVNNEMTTADSEEVTEMLEGFSGTNEADAEAIAAALQNNDNLEEAYTADGYNVLVKEKGNQYYTAYSLYDLQPAFSENVSEDVEALLALPRNSSRRKVHLYNDRVSYGDVAIFNFFSNEADYTVQNNLVRSIYTRFLDNNYDVTLYDKQGFTQANLQSVLDDAKNHNSYTAILIFSHGLLRNDANTTTEAEADLVTGEVVAEENICDCWHNPRDDKYYKTVPMAMDPGKNCILYMGACFGTCWGQPLGGGGIKSQITYVGWNGINSISQAHAAIVFDRMLYRGMTLNNALESSFHNDPLHKDTRLDSHIGTPFSTDVLKAPYNDMYNQDWGDYYTKYPELDEDNYLPDVTITFDKGVDVFVKKKWNSTSNLAISGKVSGSNAGYAYPLMFYLLPITEGKRHHEGLQINSDYILDCTGKESNDRFSIDIPLPKTLKEGVYQVKVVSPDIHISPDGRRKRKILKVANPFYVVYSEYFSDNYALPELTDADTQKPVILGEDGQPVEEITVPKGNSKTYNILGYEGHTFNAVSLHSDIVSVSVTGNTLTVTGVSEESTYIGVYDEQNRKMTAALVTVTAGVSSTDHEYVDLGLPSGTLWATCNVGANKSNEYGDNFAWGETEPKEDYSWETYKLCKGTDRTMTKYCINSNIGYNGFTDNLIELLPEDDAATANWGSDWQMPSIEQLNELINSNYTTKELSQLNGTYGWWITSKSNGASIFLPVEGYTEDFYEEACVIVETWYETYWSRSLQQASDGGYTLHIYAQSENMNYYEDFTTDGWSLRCSGNKIRPVRKQ